MITSIQVGVIPRNNHNELVASDSVPKVALQDYAFSSPIKSHNFLHELIVIVLQTCSLVEALDNGNKTNEGQKAQIRR